MVYAVVVVLTFKTIFTNNVQANDKCAVTADWREDVRKRLLGKNLCRGIYKFILNEFLKNN